MRKHKYIRSFLLVILGFTFVYPAFSQSVKGFAFEDENNNGIRDVGERGIPGVLISDQKNVTRTDEEGKYTIEVTGESVIFIIKPAGYKTPLNNQNLPLFYYIHQPQGSPDFKYPGVKPTGDLPEEINFPLYKYDEPDEFEVLVFADPQTRNLEEVYYMRNDVLNELIGYPASFVLVLGDIMYDDLSLYEDYNGHMATLGFPVYNVPGNHDMNYDAPEDLYALETFKRYFGPTYYGFQYGQVHFFVLDDVKWINRGGEEAHYIGALGEQQLYWLEQCLAYIPDEDLIVLTMHIPLHSSLEEGPSVNVTDRDKLFSILKDKQRCLALAGHMHQIDHCYLNKIFEWSGKNKLHQITCATVSGTWWSGPRDERGIPIADQRDGVPNGYHIFTFSGTKYKERFKAASADEDFQLRIIYPVGNITKQEISDSVIVVNVFNGGEKSVVSYRIDNNDYHDLNQKFDFDPHFVSIYNQNKETYNTWIKPQKSNHIWTGKLTQDLNPGIHVIEVQTTDQYGHRYRSASIFEVTE
jgi:3',5'-cyclic AMP phosphodiesterase CpdA